jgi:hypothetical protein
MRICSAFDRDGAESLRNKTPASDPWAKLRASGGRYKGKRVHLKVDATVALQQQRLGREYLRFNCST